jgi:hypothetical protein
MLTLLGFRIDRGRVMLAALMLTEGRLMMSVPC